MKNIFFICLCALFAFTGCADDDDDLLTGGNVDIDLLPDSKPNDVVNTNVFDIINLNYPGLEKVKEFYETGEYYYAANALLEYYRTRTNVTNPNLSLINVTISEADQTKADYALEDYRFHVNNFYEDQETLKPYSLRKMERLIGHFLQKVPLTSIRNNYIAINGLFHRLKPIELAEMKNTFNHGLRYIIIG